MLISVLGCINISFFQSLAKLVTEQDLNEGRIYPALSKIREVSALIAVDVAEYAYANQMAAHYPEPEDKSEFIRSQIYSTDYQSFLPDHYDWPMETSPQP